MANVRPGAKVVAGAKGPENRAQPGPDKGGADNLKEQLASIAKGPAQIAKKDGERVFHSPFYGYVYQVTAPIEERLPNGTVLRSRPKKAKFERGVFRTSDAEIIEALLKAEEYGRDFFDAQELAEKSHAAAKANLIETVRGADADTRAEILAALSGEDFQVPSKAATV